MLNTLSRRFLLCVVFFMSFADEVFGSDALKKVSEGATTLHDIVAGPLGKIALIGGTIIGVFKSLQSGSIMAALAILLIGILTSWHIESITTIFK